MSTDTPQFEDVTMPFWRVAMIDNFAREHISDRMFCATEDVETANRIANAMNAQYGPGTAKFFAVYPPNKPLYYFNP